MAALKRWFPKIGLKFPLLNKSFILGKYLGKFFKDMVVLQSGSNSLLGYAIVVTKVLELLISTKFR